MMLDVVEGCQKRGEATFPWMRKNARKMTLKKLMQCVADICNQADPNNPITIEYISKDTWPGAKCFYNLGISSL